MRRSLNRRPLIPRSSKNETRMFPGRTAMTPSPRSLARLPKIRPWRPSRPFWGTTSAGMTPTRPIGPPKWFPKMLLRKPRRINLQRKLPATLASRRKAPGIRPNSHRATLDHFRPFPTPGRLCSLTRRNGNDSRLSVLILIDTKSLPESNSPELPTTLRMSNSRSPKG